MGGCLLFIARDVWIENSYRTAAVVVVSILAMLAGCSMTGVELHSL
jgi:hypothetical protein